MTTLSKLPQDFDVDTIGDQSNIRPDLLAVFRELAFRKAAADRVWFFNQFWMVFEPDTQKWVKFRLRDYQYETEEWLAPGFTESRWRGIAGKARQIGQTTQVVGGAVHDALFQSWHPWLVVSQTEPDAQRTLINRAKTPYLKLPVWFRQMLADKAGVPQFLVNDNKESMEFANGSRIDSVVSTPNVARGDVVYGVVMDESAHQAYPAEVFTALDPLCYGPLYNISTGKGMGNFFHEKWQDSQLSDSEWHPIFHPWWVVPGRTQAWYDRQKRLYRGNEPEFYQEYPATPEEMFAKTGLTVLPMDILREHYTQHGGPPAYRIDLDAWVTDDESWQWRRFLNDGETSYNELWVWKPPEIERDPEKGYMLREPNYVVFADTAEGLPHGDETAVTVWNSNTLEQVASYVGHYPIENLGELLYKIGEWYMWALMMPERNNQGILPINDLWKYLHYPRIYRMAHVAEIPKSDRTPKLGWQTTVATKPKMIFEFIKALRDDTIILHDERFLAQAGTFIKSKRGYEASEGNKDDMVIAMLGGYQGVLEVGQFPIVWKEPQEWKPVTFKDIIDLGFADEDERPLSLLDLGINKRRSRRRERSFTI